MSLDSDTGETGDVEGRVEGRIDEARDRFDEASER
jgi:hypothetical protein